jgi:hypothetical protein
MAALPENTIIANASQFRGFMDLTGFVCALKAVSSLICDLTRERLRVSDYRLVFPPAYSMTGESKETVVTE